MLRYLYKMLKFLISSIIVYLALWLIAVGNGSIRAVIASLGASQFKMPAQSMGLDAFFSRYYFVYTAGILLSKTVTPSIRGMTKCFGQNNCYLAVFAVLATMFLLCFGSTFICAYFSCIHSNLVFCCILVIFLLGLAFYVKEPRERNNRENVLFQVFRCALESLQKRFDSPREGKFLDNVKEKYGTEFVESVGSVLHILKLFLPLPIYWALLAQQDSSWTFQATKLNTTLGPWRIEPDQMKAVAPLILLGLIPLWDKVILPSVHRNTRFEITPMASIALGGIAAAAAFICSGFLEEIIQVSSIPIPRAFHI